MTEATDVETHDTPASLSYRMTDAQVAILQATLDRITTQLERWGQGSWCRIPGGADRLTPAHLKAGEYHGFPLTPETVAALTEKQDHELRYLHVPVADCGTAFCVAGDIAVHNGYVFLTEQGSYEAATVVPTSMLQEVMTDPGVIWQLRRDKTSPSRVAAEILGLNEDSGINYMFGGSRTLPEIWGVAFQVTDGRITLPDTLPRVGMRIGDANMASTAAETPYAVRFAIRHALKNMRDSYGEEFDVAIDALTGQLDAMNAAAAPSTTD